jgi:NADH:ubiquinone oxidoreductase subunit 5 (subunit L)/multisubunit Na+/H+ antiporter MnhA subunit
MIHSNNDSQDLKVARQKRNQIFNSLIIVYLATLSITGLTFLSAFHAKEIILETLFLANSSFLLPSLFFINLSLTPIYAIRSILIFYFQIIKQFKKTYTENKDWRVNLSIITLTIPSLLSGFLINKNLYYKEQTTLTPLLYNFLALRMAFLTIGVIIYLKLKTLTNLFAIKRFFLTI